MLVSECVRHEWRTSLTRHEAARQLGITGVGQAPSVCQTAALLPKALRFACTCHRGLPRLRKLDAKVTAQLGHLFREHERDAFVELLYFTGGRWRGEGKE